MLANWIRKDSYRGGLNCKFRAVVSRQEGHILGPHSSSSAPASLGPGAPQGYGPEGYRTGGQRTDACQKKGTII